MSDIGVDPDLLPKIGQSPFLLKLPHTSPRTDRDHQANALHIEQIVNNLPLGTAYKTTTATTTESSILTTDPLGDPTLGIFPAADPPNPPAPLTIVVQSLAVPGAGSLTLTLTSYDTATAAYLILPGGSSLVFPVRPGGTSSTSTVPFTCTGPAQTIPIVWEVPGAPDGGWSLDFTYPVISP